jgi:FtsP/CotA-like multicopper oxidase with cupredoxin domain
MPTHMVGANNDAGSVDMSAENGNSSPVGRRSMLKIGAAATASTALPAHIGLSSALAKDPPAGPATAPFQVPLPVYAPKAPEALYPAPMREADIASGECGRAHHQGWDHWPAKKTYRLRVRQGMHSFHPSLPTQAIWGYDGILPGPTFVARYGEPAIVRIHNELPPNTTGFGSPEISTHLHNLHCASESDGFTTDYFSPTKAGPTLAAPGHYHDHHYPNCYANYDRFDATDGDPREALGTLWYHDHREGFTASNVYRGLLGFYLLFDHIDSGDENDTRESALRLPSGVGKYDIPIAISDLIFNSSGYLHYDQFNTKGHLGTKFAANGKIQPFFKVEPRKYRLRLLAASLARFFEFYVVKDGVNQTFDYIANDGNLLPAPLPMNKIALAPAERGDIVIDFSKYAGQQLYLVNRLIQKDGRGPEDALTNVRNAAGDLVAAGTQIMRFDVGTTAVADNSRVPSVLRALPPINLAEVVRTRNFRFDKENDIWTVNGKIFDPLVSVANVKRGTTEIWNLEGNGGWHHPVHIHMVEGRILSRNGKAPPAHEIGRKDVYVLAPGEKIKVLLRFSDFTGKYMMHCHNITHEDHAMMVRFDVVP